jgi:hypothetical protein
MPGMHADVNTVVEHGIHFRPPSATQDREGSCPEISPQASIFAVFTVAGPSLRFIYAQILEMRDAPIQLIVVIGVSIYVVITLTGNLIREVFMVSEKQLIANRENSKLGGVKTEAGKAAARLNAVTHGLLTKEALLAGEYGSLLRSLTEGYMAKLKPETEMEILLVERIVSCIWRLRRVLRVEKNYSNNELTSWEANIADWTGIAACTDSSVASWQSMNRYETTIERQMYKAMHELERIQRIRRGENTPAPLAIDVNLSQN